LGIHVSFCRLPLIFLSFSIFFLFFFFHNKKINKQKTKPSSNFNFSVALSAMASLLRLSIAAAILLIALSSTTVTARPCRTFIISSYSIRNPSSNTYATITEIRSISPLFINDKPYEIVIDRPIQHHNLHLETQSQGASHPRGPLGFSTDAYDFSSLRDRTKDILSVALALLFGVGCGALTAATMYLVWSVFTARHELRAAAYGEFSDDEIESPKKMGYVKIPAAEVAAAAAATAPAPPVKD
jgi:hypothetical protein